VERRPGGHQAATPLAKFGDRRAIIENDDRSPFDGRRSLSREVPLYLSRIVKKLTDLPTLISALAILISVSAQAETAPTSPPPNVIVIMADDLGEGDLGCYGATAIKTPHIDRLAADGRRFTQAYAPASTCTPSRYSFLTGNYAWRQPPQKTSILDGDSPLSIVPGSSTLPAVFQRAGYATGLVGKWHLGLGDGAKPLEWNGNIRPGPLEVGFDQAFYFPATLDRVPCVFVRDHGIVNLDPADPISVNYLHRIGSVPLGTEHPHWLKMGADEQHSGSIINGISRIGYMSGGHAARWVDEAVGDTLLTEAEHFIAQNQAHPFFLYFAAHEPHVPRVPNPRFRGATALGPRGDSIAEFDWVVGEILGTLDRLNLTQNTLVILSSDNGPILFDGYHDGAAEKNGSHQPAGGLRGWKYLIYEGGTRVPFIARWPGHIPTGQSSDLICLTDMVATAAALTRQQLPPGAAIDSSDALPVLLGHPAAQSRTAVVEQGISGALALRDGDWKYVPANVANQASGMGAGANPNDERFRDSLVPTALLFNLATDPHEEHNLAPAQPQKAAELARELERIRAQTATLQLSR
jgi:arylsulfatase A-like enzyme